MRLCRRAGPCSVWHSPRIVSHMFQNVHSTVKRIRWWSLNSSVFLRRRNRLEKAIAMIEHIQNMQQYYECVAARARLPPLPSPPPAIFIDCKSVSIPFHSFSFRACSELNPAHILSFSLTHPLEASSFPDSGQFHVSCHHYILSNDKLCINQLSKFWLYTDREKKKTNERGKKSFFSLCLRHVNCVRTFGYMYLLHMAATSTFSVAIVTMQTSVVYTYAADADVSPHIHRIRSFREYFFVAVVFYLGAFISHANKRQSHSSEQRTATATAKSSKRESNVNAFFVRLLRLSIIIIIIKKYSHSQDKHYLSTCQCEEHSEEEKFEISARFFLQLQENSFK